MNALIEIEANEFSQLFKDGDTLGIRMFMEHVNMPLDVKIKFTMKSLHYPNLSKTQLLSSLKLTHTLKFLSV